MCNRCLEDSHAPWKTKVGQARKTCRNVETLPAMWRQSRQEKVLFKCLPSGCISSASPDSGTVERKSGTRIGTHRDKQCAVWTQEKIQQWYGVWWTIFQHRTIKLDFRSDACRKSDDDLSPRTCAGVRTGFSQRKSLFSISKYQIEIVWWGRCSGLDFSRLKQGESYVQNIFKIAGKIYVVDVSQAEESSR